LAAEHHAIQLSGDKYYTTVERLLLNELAPLPDAPLRFSAVPVKVKDCGTFPMRAFAVFGDGGL